MTETEGRGRETEEGGGVRKRQRSERGKAIPRGILPVSTSHCTSAMAPSKWEEGPAFIYSQDRPFTLQHLA